MASANVELVRSIYQRWERGDFTWGEWVHPEVEYVWVGGPVSGSWSGAAEMWRVFRDFLDAWQEWRIEADEYRELDGERVVVLVRYLARGRTSGIDLGNVRTRGAQLFHVRDAKVTRLVNYFDRDSAVVELGLAPEADSSASEL